VDHNARNLITINEITNNHQEELPYP